MKLKQINLSFFVLASLIMLSLAFYSYADERLESSGNIFLDSDQDGLSDEEEKTYGTDPKNRDTDGDSYSDGAEVRSGYDPMKPAPGDKVGENIESVHSPEVLGVESEAAKVKEKGAVDETESAGLSTDEDSIPEISNLTDRMALELSDITSEDQEVSVEDIQTMIEDALSSSQIEPDLPVITEDLIKIKEQDYKGTDEEIKSRKKEDFLNYIVAVYYILSSNSPEPVTSMSNLSSVSSGLVNQILMSVSFRNTEALDDLTVSGEKIFEAMTEVEVPEDLVELHIKGLRFAQYAVSVKDNLNPDPDDPMADIAGLSKIRGLIDQLSGFSTDIAAKFSEYDIAYDDSMKERLKESGLFAPDDTVENEEAMRSLVPEE